MAKKKLTNEHLTNKDMSPAVYELRRNIIALIYEAKKLYPELPRITVRVANRDKNDKVMGVGRMGKNIIWISEDFVASRCVVFHEILHAAFATEHVPGCPLMAAQIDDKLSQKQCDALFLKYARGGK